MFELLFVIFLENGKVIKEYFPDDFSTVQECELEGYLLVEELAQQVLDKHPDMVEFDIECRAKQASV